MEALPRASDVPEIDGSIPPKEQHWLKLETLRNQALICALADSGARARILRLTAGDVRGCGVSRCVARGAASTVGW